MTKGCVILAAGRNSRLDTGKPKSLLRINNQSLLERHIDLFTKAGVSQFCIITGYQAEKIDREVHRINEAFSVEIATVHNSRFDLENGYSVWSAKKWLEEQNLGQFILTMADHVFDPHLVLNFVNFKVSKQAVLQLAVDKPGPQNEHIDLEDVTKVKVKDGVIQEIGKGINEYNYFDTGLFLMKAKIMDEFELNFKNGGYSISNTVQSLASQGEARVIDMSGFLWNDVDNPDDYEKSKGLRLN